MNNRPNGISTLQLLTYLFLARLVANGRSQVNSVEGAVRVATLDTADEESEARLLEYRRVVIVRVAHRPAAAVLRRLATSRLVHALTVPVRPRVEPIMLLDLVLYNNTRSRVTCWSTVQVMKCVSLYCVYCNAHVTRSSSKMKV